MNRTILKADQAFDMTLVTKRFNETPLKSYQAIDISAPDTTKPKDERIEKQKYINITFRPLGDEKNRFRSAGTKARLVSIFETTNRALFLDAVELFETASKIPATEVGRRREIFMQMIQDNVKFFDVTSKLNYKPRGRNGEFLPDIAAGGDVVTNNHTFFLFEDDSLIRAVTARVRSISDWLDEVNVNTGYDANSGTTVEAEDTTFDDLDPEGEDDADKAAKEAEEAAKKAAALAAAAKAKAGAKK